jgi:hypothetical protein
MAGIAKLANYIRPTADRSGTGAVACYNFRLSCPHHGQRCGRIRQSAYPAMHVPAVWSRPGLHNQPLSHFRGVFPLHNIENPNQLKS